MTLVRWIAALGLMALTGCATTGRPEQLEPDRSQTGIASFYASRHHGRRTASGERYDQEGLTAAHRTLPFGTRVRVTNLSNDRSLVVTITDRGPFVKGRIIDVSRRAARELDFVREGVTRVRVRVIRD